MNNAIYASTGFTPSYVNGLTHPRVSVTLPLRVSGLVVGDMADRIAKISPATVYKRVSEFLALQLIFLRHVRDAL